MSSLLAQKPCLSQGTSAGGAMRSPVNRQRTSVVTVSIFITHSTDTANESIICQDLLRLLERTTSGLSLPFHSIHSTETNRIALNKLRQLSGLTWEQLANLFNVSRRSLHFWASGQPLSRSNEEKLNRFLGTIHYIDRGSADLNRSLLMQTSSDGRLLLDLLVMGEHEAVKRILGSGNTSQKPQLAPLSEKTRAERKQTNPADLVDALQDTIHREVGRVRPAKTARNRRNSSD